MIKPIAAATLIAASIAGSTVAHAQGMLLDYAADRVIQKYQTSSCAQLKQARTEGPTDKEKAALAYLHDDAQARVEFINRIAAPVANKMFECDMFP